MVEPDSTQEIASIRQSIFIMNFLAVLPIIYLVLSYALSMFLVTNDAQWGVSFNDNFGTLIVSVIFIFMNLWLILGVIFSKFMIDTFPADISPFQNLGKYFLVDIIAIQLPAILLLLINFFAIFGMNLHINIVYNLIYTVILVFLGYYFAMVYKNRIISYYGSDYLNT